MYKYACTIIVYNYSLESLSHMHAEIRRKENLNAKEKFNQTESLHVANDI